LAAAFSVLGATAGARPLPYFILALLMQNVWWLGFWSLAELFVGQQFITRSNFYLYLAALFAVWLAYELIGRKAIRANWRR
jgi:hypothetical protein